MEKEKSKKGDDTDFPLTYSLGKISTNWTCWSLVIGLSSLPNLFMQLFIFHSTLMGTKLNPVRPSQVHSKAHSPTAYHGLRARRSIRARVSCVVQLWRRYLNPRMWGIHNPPVVRLTAFTLLPIGARSIYRFLCTSHPRTHFDRPGSAPAKYPNLYLETPRDTSAGPHRVGYDGRQVATVFFRDPPLRLYTRPNGDLPIREKKVGRVEPLKWSHLRLIRG
jgi:hypothetical protein